MRRILSDLLEAGRSRSSQIMIAGLVPLALMFAALTAFEIARGSEEVFERAVGSGERFASSFARGLAPAIAGYDRGLRSAVASLTLPGIAGVEDDIRRKAIFGAPSDPFLFGPMLIADAQGIVRETNASDSPVPSSVADQPAFTVHRDRADAGRFVGQVEVLDGGARSRIPVSYRVPNSDGSFGGIVLGSLIFGDSTRTLADVDPGRGRSLTLMAMDGTLAARIPWRNRATGMNLHGSPAFEPTLASDRGVFSAPSKIDGTSRLYVFVHVEDFPLIAVAATTLSTIYAPWRQQAYMIGGATVAMCATMLGLAVMLRRELARRRAAEAEAVETARHFREIVDTATDVILRLGPDGTRRFVSPSSISVLGYRPEELIGRPWTKVAVADDAPSLEQALGHLREGADELTVKYRAIHRDSRILWLEARLRAIRDPVTRQLRELVAIARDVTWQQHLEDELSAQASTDGLTGAANRRHFDEQLDAEWRRAARTGSVIALLLLDADMFKAFNDRYGHLEGDAVLRTIVQCATAFIRRPGDLAARYGGEEFAVLLPGTALEGALHIGEAIRAAVQARAIPHDQSPVGAVTVSIGAACVVAAIDIDPNSLIAMADQALYSAKRAGRNRVMHVQQAAELAAD